MPFGRGRTKERENAVMLSVESLKSFGANTEEGLGRVFNNEAFYLRLVGMALADKNFDKLKTALEAQDAKAAFEAAHALKGSIGNMALTPIYEPICALTEKLRGQEGPVDTGDLLDQVLTQLEKARAL